MLQECQNESGLQPVAWTVLMFRVTPEYVQLFSKVLAPLNYLRSKPPKRRTDPNERRRKQ